MRRCQHSFKKFLQIYELFAQDPSVSKKFPTLASPRLYLDIFFHIYEFIFYFYLAKKYFLVWP